MTSSTDAPEHHIKLFATTQIVVRPPNGTPPRGDLGAIFIDGPTPAEKLIEYAGRVCYKSTARMGDAPDFIAVRVREGHEDICEHAWASFLMPSAKDHALLFFAANRYIEVTPINQRLSLVSGNMRALRDFVKSGHGAGLLPSLLSISPSVFGDLGRKRGITALDMPKMATVPYFDPCESTFGCVTPLAVNLPNLAALRAYLPSNDHQSDHVLGTVAEDHTVFSFLIEGVSRSLTHQLVRHRTLSVSQESQRYVNLDKGEWDVIVPPSFAAVAGGEERMLQFWADAQAAYRDLRALGVRNEDARYLLPNATTTRLVVTGTTRGWRHFCDQRLAKAAQWEIRGLANCIDSIIQRVVPTPEWE